MRDIYGFVPQEDIELSGVVSSYRYQKESFVVAEITNEVYQGLSAQMMEVKNENLLDYKMYMEKLECQFLLVIWQEQEEERLYFFSNTKRVRALEFLDYLIPEFGLVKGDAKAAGGRISDAILKVQIAEMDLENALAYFLKMSDSYFCDCDCIIGAEYGVKNADMILNMQQYTKKQVPWAFVKSIDVATVGEVMHIKSLENESGLEIVADPDTYIMIGCRGEIYDIKREKFERTYEVTNESLDIFERMLDFLPEAKVVSTGEFISLDENAYLCYPKSDAGIYAKKLEKRTKVFPAGEGVEYFLGRPGDYLAVRPDDFCDIYVIEGEIFRQTYEEKK